MTPKQEALAKGLLYYNGKPCKEGHTLRYTKGSMCVECAKNNSRLFVKDNPEKFKEYQSTYRKTPAGRESTRKTYNNWYSKNREKVCAAQRERYRRNKEKQNDHKK